MEGITFTPAESKLLISIMKNNKAAVQPDWEAVAKECGYGSTKAASACWSRVRKTKLEGGETVIGGFDKKSPGKKATAKPKKASANGKSGKAAVKAEEEYGDGEVEEETDEAAMVKEEEVEGESGVDD